MDEPLVLHWPTDLKAARCKQLSLQDWVTGTPAYREKMNYALKSANTDAHVERAWVAALSNEKIDN